MVAKMKKRNKANSRFEFLYKNNNLLNSKRSQVTIFIIIALIIVVAIALIFVLRREPTITISPSTDPQGYIEKCTRDAGKEALEILMPQGGFIEPESSIMYQDVNRTYLCYINTFYQTCINQRPHLTKDIEQEITDYIKPKMQSCFLSLEQELKKRNYNVETGNMEIITELKPKSVFITINRKFKLTKNQETRTFEKFKTRISSPVYDLAILAEEIVHQEAQFCNFEILGLMILYPQYDLDKFVTGSGEKIYTTREKSTDKEFVFAVRSCVLPPGY